MKLRILFVLSIAMGVLVSTAPAEDPGGSMVTHLKSKSWLGVSIQDVTPRFARDHHLAVHEGAYVSHVMENSPAESAGIEEGDVITEFNGKNIELADDLSDAVKEVAPETKTDVMIMRNNEKKKIAVTVGTMKSRRPMAFFGPEGSHILINKFEQVEGMDLMELNDQLGAYFDAPNNEGVLVKRVEEKSSADAAGVKAGDVITAIGDRTVDDMDDIREALDNTDEGDTVELAVLRKGKTEKLSLKITESSDEPMMWRWDSDNLPDFRFWVPKESRKMRQQIEMQLRHLPAIPHDIKGLQLKIKDSGSET